MRLGVEDEIRSGMGVKGGGSYKVGGSVELIAGAAIFLIGASLVHANTSGAS